MNDLRIAADNLGKRFAHRGPRPAGSWRRLLAARGPAPEPFWALREVSFQVRAGEMLGVIGPNGAGKSTLLSLLGGLSDPTTGRAVVHGRLGALLELGGGFADDLSGRENAILAGVVAGLTRGEVRACLDEIVDFAGIREFFDDPVRTYSTGMRMRLAFAVAVHTDPDVLLVDEFLAVGDISFQAKCRQRIADLRAGGCAVVLVSHGMGDVRETCDRVLWLRDGRIAALDTPEVVTDRYEAEMHERTLQRTPDRSRLELPDGRRVGADAHRIGSLEMEIADVRFRSGAALRSGASLLVELVYRSRETVIGPIFGISITREDGTICVDTNTESARVSTERLPPEGIVRFSIPRLELGAGRYFVNAGIFDPTWSHAYDYHWHVHPLVVHGAEEHKGIHAPPCRWEALPLGDASGVAAVTAARLS